MSKLYYYIIIYIIILILTNKGYLTLVPSLPIYPNNNLEVQQVHTFIKKRTKQDIKFFNKTNRSVIYAFKPYVKESLQELSIIEQKQVHLILLFKYVINRARPQQIDKSIVPLNISTAQTPAYPAGHAYQAYYIAKELSKRYPKKQQLFLDIALECDITRIKAGLHYPSDG